MSTDLIHRLRVSADEWLPTSDHTLRAHKLLDEAANELERKSDAIQRLWKERDQLRAEVEALRADAERYRWLRERGGHVWTVWQKADRSDECRAVGDKFDMAVDASRQA